MTAILNSLRQQDTCWSYRNDGMGINGGYQNASVEIVDNINEPPGTSCWAIWQFDPEIEAPAGDYDVYAHVPAYASTLHAYYTIHHNGETDEAVVVQAAYPNQEHDEWAYLGRYDFGLNDGISNATYEDKDYITVSNLTISDTASIDAVVVADAIRLLPADPLPNKEIPISQSSDDAGGPNPYNAGVCGYEVNKNALTMNEIYFGHCQNGTPTVSGFHFDNVQIPEDVTITAARLEFTVDTTPNNVIDVQFQGELVNDAATFSSSSLPHQRSPLTNAIVTWHLAEDGGWQVSEAQASPDLSSIIQEIIDQPGWQSGHAITIITQPTGNGTQARRVYGWERYGGNPLQTAKLQLWYDEPATPTPTPVPTITPTASPTPSSSVPAPTGLTAVYITGIPQPSTSKLQESTMGLKPIQGHVRLSWQSGNYPSGTTFTIYRHTAYPVPVDAAHRITSGVDNALYIDFSGKAGNWYVITAVTPDGTSPPSNQAKAYPYCPEC